MVVEISDNELKDLQEDASGAMDYLNDSIHSLSISHSASTGEPKNDDFSPSHAYSDDNLDQIEHEASKKEAHGDVSQENKEKNEAEVTKNESNEAEVTKNEVELKEAEVPKSESKEAELKDHEFNETTDSKPESNDSESPETAAEKADVAEPAVTKTGPKETEANQIDGRDPEEGEISANETTVDDSENKENAEKDIQDVAAAEHNAATGEETANATLSHMHPPLPPRHHSGEPLPPRRHSGKDTDATVSDDNPFSVYQQDVTDKKKSKRNSLIKLATVNPVPPSLKEELNNPVFLKNLKIISPPELPLRDVSKNSAVEGAAEFGGSVGLQKDKSPEVDISEKIDIIRANSKALSPDFDLIINRFKINSGLRDVSDAGIKDDEQLKESFKEVIDHEEEKTETINFWNSLILDYDSTIKQHPEKLERLIFQEGIPSELRPFVWKFITQSNLKNLEVLYANNVVIKSEHTSQIEKDIKRTKFIPLEKQEMLKNVCLAYSNYDQELGYTQGLCFIVAPLILTLDSEAEVFSLLVKLMHDYNLRSFYTNQMPGLMLKMYQFEKLLQEFSPAIQEHLAKCGIVSNMFVSQWFLSFFGYKFPYEFVIRIFDIILLEGLEALLKFAIIVMLMNEEKILSMKFDELLEFLKDDLFNIYLMKNEESGGDPASTSSDTESVKKSGLPKYNVSQFVLDAMQIKLMPISLKTITDEYEEISELKKTFNPSDKEIQRLKIINKNQVNELLKVKSSFNILKKDHELIANELINKRQVIFNLNDQVQSLTEDVLDWKKKYNQMIENSKLDNPDASIPTDLKEGLDQVLSNNKRVMERNLELEHEVEALKETIAGLNNQLKNFASHHSEKKWNPFKKQ